jgi:sn-1 stearoyl-lipid 9-desaturase
LFESLLSLNQQQMSFISSILEAPSYGWTDEHGDLVKPSGRQIIREFLHHLNIFSSRKNWLVFVSWGMVACLVPFTVIFFAKYFSVGMLLLGLTYSIVGMGTHGTIWFHRYGTHQAYQFSNTLWRLVTQNLVIRMLPEEVYIVSHHVHHALSDKPGDPYNARGGWLYCFLADANHQRVSRHLSRTNYERVRNMLKHTGVKCNTYEQYQRWGTVSHPSYVLISTMCNWLFWGAVFFLAGGFPLVCTLFGSACFWALGIRTFNFHGHGRGHDRRREGVDFNRRDMSVNQLRPGFLTGEWHNNHHLFPHSARAGFLPHQVDFAWYYIYMLYLAGGVSSFHDARKQFMEKYYLPYREGSQKVKEARDPAKKHSTTVSPG